jgi:glycosyltransferase involved in cell wall biosynthesis
VTESLRVLIAGWPNSPHVISWAEVVAAAGYEVHLVGRAPPQWPPASTAAKVHPLPDEGLPLVRSLRMSRALADVAAEVSPDLVHAHWLPELGWMAAREGLRPLICSAWGSDVFGIRGLARRRSKRALDGAALALADSLHLARVTRELADREIPVEVVRWGLDFERFAPGDLAAAREALGLEGDGPLVVSVRGFDPVYNPELQLEAFARILARRPEARLLLKNPKVSVPSEVEATVKRLGLGEAVVLLGNLPPERMPDVYRAADVVVSIPSSDSSPRSVWEALACGRPVVVSDLPWARDELAPDREALFVPLEADSIAEAIERVLEDVVFAQQLGADARALALAELDPAICRTRIDALYRRVVEENND